MKKILFLVSFCLLMADMGLAQPEVSHYADSVRWGLQYVRRRLAVRDSFFTVTADSLSRYAVSDTFSPGQQVANLHGLHQLLLRMADRSALLDGRYMDQLQFAFSVMDWRREGVLYDQLSLSAGFALRCAALFAGDTAGRRFISYMAESDPGQVLASADQLPGDVYYRHVIEQAILSDPDFAKRYLFSDNTVSRTAASSTDTQVRGLFKLFSDYGSRTPAYVLYDAVARDIISKSEADSIAQDSRMMLRILISLLATEHPLGKRSLLRETEYRVVEQMRASSLWPQARISEVFAPLSADEKLVMLAYGYRECGSRALGVYLHLMESADLSTVSPALIRNLSDGPLPGLIKALDKEDKLAAFLEPFGPEEQHSMTRLLAAGDRHEGTPLLRTVIATGEAENPSAPAEEPEPEAKAEPVVKDTARPHKTSKPKPEPADEIAVQPIHIVLSDSARGLLALKRNIFMALQDIPSFVHKSYARAALLYAAMVEPDEVIKKIEMYKGKYWCKEVLERAALNAPINARRYLDNKTHPVTVILTYSQNPAIKKLIRLNREAEYQSKPFLLFDEIVRDSLSLSDATEISSSEARLFRELMRISARANCLGRYNVEEEMNYYALHYVRTLNDKTGQPEAIRFAAVDELSCDELYYMMVYGREEVFNSTFEGMYARFERKCSASGQWTAAHFAAFPHYRSFIALCATYGRLDRFLSLFAPSDRIELLTAFATGLQNEPDELSEAATVAETIANTNTPSTLQTLLSVVKNSYEVFDSVQDYNGMSIYGILAALCRDKASPDRPWYAMMARKYKTGSLTTLSSRALTGQKPFVERMYFYDDEDGRDSYQNFIKTFSGSHDWRIEQNYSYVKVASQTGAKIELYANKADLPESGDKEICKIIADNGYEVKCVIHRGHSFHTEETLNKVPSTARFVLVGSCGGFYKINIALRKAPDAQIIATRQIGVKQVNDPLLYSFNEYLRQGRDINWKTFWDEMKTKVGASSYFNDYVPPHKNLEAMFVRAYYEIMGG
ncbi:MAG: hypothetical protein JST83_12560 [Bacteroidetes bacterium]|nr:hypothetical protein [Bacteroidota bacterium]